MQMLLSEIRANIEEMNSEQMSEIDQLVMMVDTQRAIMSLMPRPSTLIDDVMDDMMEIEVPYRSHRYKEMYDVSVEYYKLLQEGKDADTTKKEELKQKLDELSAPFSDNPALHAFLEMERMAAGL